jgi:ornithine cyclodeaminase/alanine dehydrogenase-like protein (mu-crystallin family)
MKLRILSEADCRSLISMADAIDIQAEAFNLLAAGRAVEGLRAVASSKSPPGVAIFNPCFLRGGGGYGIKVVSDFSGNTARALPRMSSILALFDGETGLPHTLMESGYLTDLRTGAGTGLAARHLARVDSKVAAVIGAGRVARNQIEALASALPLECIKIHARNPRRSEALLNALPDNLENRIHFEFHDAEAAVRDADIVVAATTSAEPVVRGDWLRPGTFVVATGAYAAHQRELDSETIRRASCRVIDSRADCLDRAGDFVIPIGAGVIAREDVAQLSEIISGERPGRQTALEIIVYKSSGVPIQDIVTAQHIQRRAAANNVGVEIEIGGDHD